MRLSSVMFAVVLLFTPVVFAQHSSTSSAPSSPPASAAPSSPPPAPAPSPASSSSSASSFHSAPSSPSPASPPSSSPSFGNSGSMGSHASSAPASSTSQPAASRSAQPSEGRTSETTPDRISPEPKIGSEEKIAPSSRIAEAPAAKEKDQDQDKGKHPRSPESDLRRPVCKDGPCKEVVPKEPVESDLRRPVCKGKPCTCPTGEVLGKNGGCVASNPTIGSDQCGTGQYWNGAACAAIGRTCQANEYWNGVACVNSQTECASFSASAALTANEVRAVRVRMQNACMNDPSGQECSDLKQSYAAALERYRMAISGAPVNCQATLPDPLSL